MCCATSGYTRWKLLFTSPALRSRWSSPTSPLWLDVRAVTARSQADEYPVTSVVLSIGSNVGDRMVWLQSVVDGLDGVVAVSPVYETDAWGGVEQAPFLNAVVIADDPALDAHGWLRRAHELEDAAQRVRGQRWGPRTLDVDVVTCRDGDGEMTVHDEVLILPHPYAHVRAFVLVPWSAVDSGATLTVAGRVSAVEQLLGAVDQAERAGVRMTDLALRIGNETIG